MNLKDRLIRLGSEHPRLRDHLRPVLDRISRPRGRFDSRAAGILQVLMTHMDTELRRGLSKAAPEDSEVRNLDISITENPDISDKSVSTAQIDFRYWGSEMAVKLELRYNLDNEKGSLMYNFWEDKDRKIKDAVKSVSENENLQRVASDIVDHVIEMIFMY